MNQINHNLEGEANSVDYVRQFVDSLVLTENDVYKKSKPEGGFYETTFIPQEIDLIRSLATNESSLLYLRIMRYCHSASTPDLEGCLKGIKEGILKSTTRTTIKSIPKRKQSQTNHKKREQYKLIRRNW